MKKIVVLIAAVLALNVFAGQALARGGDGTGPRGGGCPAYASNDSPEMQKFLDATQELRKSLVADQAELNAVMAAQNPDSKKARELAVKIADTRSSIQAKARELKVSGAGRGYGPMVAGCGGGGCGYGQGRGGRGAGGPCGR
jgi:zinc resistance-associated protein